MNRKKNYSKTNMIILLLLAVFGALLVFSISGPYLTKNKPGQEDFFESDDSSSRLQKSAIGEKHFVASDLRSLSNVLKTEIEGKNYLRPMKSRAETIERAREDYERFMKLIERLSFLTSSPLDLKQVPDSVWKEIGLSPLDGEQMIFHATRNVAISLFHYAERYRQVSGQDQTPVKELADANLMMEFIWAIIFGEEWISPDDLKFVDDSGKEVKITEAKIYSIARADLAERIAYLRKEIDDRYLVDQRQGHIALLKAAEDGGYKKLAKICRKVNTYPEKQRTAFPKIAQEVHGINDAKITEAFSHIRRILQARQEAIKPLLSLAKRGIDFWHFDQKTLGLTAEEWNMLKPRNIKGQMHT